MLKDHIVRRDLEKFDDSEKLHKNIFSIFL